MSEALAWIDEQQDALQQRLQQWSSINSGSHNLAGLAEMHRTLAAAFVEASDSVESLTADSYQIVRADGVVEDKEYGAMLHCLKRPDAKRRILLVGHMDTVFPADSAFQQPTQIDDDTLHGPGVADMKGGLLCMLTALTAYEKFTPDPQLGWEVLINADEELGSHGSRATIANLATRSEVGLVYEPALADGTMVSARKGSGNFSLVVRGKAAHAGREFNLGRNAIAQLASGMQALHRLNEQRDSIICNLGIITGGTVVNSVADLAICHFNVRTETAEDEIWIQDQLTTILASINAEDGYQAELHGGLTRPPKDFSPEIKALFSLLNECSAQLGFEIKHQATGGCCDGNNLAAAGLPNIDTLGVRGGAIHTEDEFMLLNSLTERSKLSYLLLEKLNRMDSFEHYLKGQSAC